MLDCLWCLIFLAPAISSAGKVALIVIDVQNCFIPGGTLGIVEGDQIIPVINNIRRTYSTFLDLVVISQDWHCPDHVSFASVHAGHQPSSTIKLTYNSEGKLCWSPSVTSKYAVNCSEVTYNVDQVLWPDHCVIGTEDAKISSAMTSLPSDVLVRKGYNCGLDSYSAFFDNGGFGKTELHDVLKEHGITSVYITGLARDYCVYWTAKDALKLGYKTYVVVDATRPVAAATGETAVEDMKAKGIYIIDSKEMGDYLRTDKSMSPALKTSTILTLLSLCVLFV